MSPRSATRKGAQPCSTWCRAIKARLYPVGRLDYLSEGLLLLTNDGALMQKLTHASSHVPKTYLVKVSGKPAEADIAKLREGIFLPAERTRLKSPEAQQTGNAGRTALRSRANCPGENQAGARRCQSLV